MFSVTENVPTLQANEVNQWVFGRLGCCNGVCHPDEVINRGCLVHFSYPLVVSIGVVPRRVELSLTVSRVCIGEGGAVIVIVTTYKTKVQRF